LVFVGWVTQEKGVFEAIEVLYRLRRRHPFTTLTVVGSGRDLELFRARVHKRGLTDAVRLCGWLDRQKVQCILRDSDVFLFPSHSEGLPNAVLEAMAAGLPVVATRVGGVPDLICDGQNGFLVDVGDIDGMTTHISDLMQDPERASRIGALGRQTVTERCNIERVWPRFEEAIHRAVGWVGRAEE
jgi:glycosyltransferase involved in cell wall biosynthesis